VTSGEQRERAEAQRINDSAVDGHVEQDSEEKLDEMNLKDGEINLKLIYLHTPGERLTKLIQRLNYYAARSVNALDEYKNADDETKGMSSIH
jgi:hypothetical protein